MQSKNNGKFIFAIGSKSKILLEKSFWCNKCRKNVKIGRGFSFLNKWRGFGMKYKIKIIDENEQKEINIGEDEIIEIKYNIGLAENTDFANNRSSIEMTVTGKVISNIENNGTAENDKNSNYNTDLYEQNKKNIIDLAKWAESYLEKNDYRNVEVFVNLGANKNIDYKFANMFVRKFSQELSIEKGIGIFVLHLKQKFHQKNKLDIK